MQLDKTVTELESQSNEAAKRKTHSIAGSTSIEEDEDEEEYLQLPPALPNFVK